MAIHIGIGNLGGGNYWLSIYMKTQRLTSITAMASNFYREQDSPKFILGHALELGFAVAGALAVLLLRMSYQKVNLKREKALADISANTASTEAESGGEGDRSLTFRYIL